MALKYGLGGHSWSLKMVPLESLGVISYSHSIATMALALSTMHELTDRPTSRDSTRPRLCIASRGKKIVVRGTAGIPNPELEHFDI